MIIFKIVLVKNEFLVHVLAVNEPVCKFKFKLEVVKE